MGDKNPQEYNIYYRTVNFLNKYGNICHHYLTIGIHVVFFLQKLCNNHLSKYKYKRKYIIQMNC